MRDREKYLVMKSDSTKIRALKILGSRAMSASEIEKRLISKGESAEDARDAVLWLEETGAINDVDFAKIIVTHYVSKGYGLAKIKDELYKRGIPKDLWEDALEHISEDASEDSVQSYLEKKLRGSTDEKDIRRVSNALLRRGFNYQQVREAIGKYLENQPDNDADIDLDFDSNEF